MELWSSLIDVILCSYIELICSGGVSCLPAALLYCFCTTAFVSMTTLSLIGKEEIWRLLLLSRIHLRIEVTLSLHLIVEMGKIWGWCQNDEKRYFQCFYIKSYVEDVY